MSKSMRDLLQRLGHWQVTYDHLLLTWAIEVEFGYKYAERTHQQILEFSKRHAGHLQNSSEVEASAPSISSTIKPCRASWQKTIRQRGTIQSIIADKRFGFITDGNDSFHFTFDAFAAREKPDVGMKVEFEPQDFFDKKRNQPGKIAVNVRPVRAAR